MAGDLGSPEIDFGGYFKLISEASSRYLDVLITMGNNEFRESTYEDTVKTVKYVINQFPNVTLLHKNIVKIQGLTFIGGFYGPT